MPSQLALILVSALVLIIIIIEHRKSGISGLAIWILSIWVLYSGSKGLGVFLNVNTSMEAGSPPDRYFLLGLGMLGIFILLKRGFQWGLVFKKNWLFILIIAYMLLSITWSRDPGISFRRWGREAITLIMMCLLVSEESPIKSFVSAFKRAIYFYLPFSLLLIKYFGIYGRQYNRWSGELMWVGLAGQKNGLALFCAFSAVFLIWFLWQDLVNWRMLESKLTAFIDIFMLALAIYLMMGPQRSLTYSATSFLSLLTGLIAMLILKQAAKKEKRLDKNIAAFALILIIVGTFMPFSGKIPIKGLAQFLGRTETLTGRTDIWNSLLPYAQKHIILGYGFGGFWTTSLRNEIASHAHNGYLDTVLALGLVGLILFSVFLVSTARTCSRLINSNWSIFLLFLSMIFMYLVHNSAESFLGEFESIPSILVCFFYFLSNEENSKIDNIAYIE